MLAEHAGSGTSAWVLSVQAGVPVRTVRWLDESEHRTGPLTHLTEVGGGGRGGRFVNDDHAGGQVRPCPSPRGHRRVG